MESVPSLPASVPAYDLRVSFQDTEPEIWRRLLVPESLTVAEFHLAVQAAFGWEDRHLFAVRCVDLHGRPRVIVGPDGEAEDLDAEQASAVVLSELLDASKPGSAAFEYGYLHAMTGEFAFYFDAAAFDLDAANRKLRLLSLRQWPQALTDEERDGVLRPVRWLLEQASPDGVDLTKDGYLKPANREINARPVLVLRQHLMDWKLLRRSGGKLVLTPRGRRGLQRPGDLWDYMVEEIARPKHDAVKLTTRLYAEWHLSGIAPPFNWRVEVIRDALVATGFVTRSGHPIPEQWAAEINQTVRASLGCLNLMTPAGSLQERARGKRALLSDGGQKFLLEVQGLLEGQ